MGTQGTGRKRNPNKERSNAEDDALNLIAREAEARLAAKRAARAEAREIRMKELERQQKEIYQVQKKYYGLDSKSDSKQEGKADARWGNIEQWMEDSERYSRRRASVSDDDERMSVGSRGSVRSDLDAIGAYGVGGSSSHSLKKKEKKKKKHKHKDSNGYDDGYSALSTRSSRLSDESKASVTRSSRLDLTSSRLSDESRASRSSRLDPQPASYASSDLYGSTGLSSSRHQLSASAYNGYQGSLYEDSLYSASRRVIGASSRPSEYSSYRGSSSRASSRASSARASPVDDCSSVASFLRSTAAGSGLPRDLDHVTIPNLSDAEDRDYLEKGSRAGSTLSAATLASLGGTSSRRGSVETSVTADTEAASIREIKEIHELKDQILDVESKYMQSLKEVKDALVEVEERYRKAMVSNAQLDNDKNNLMYQVDTLKDSLMELEELLSEARREYDEKAKDFEREKHAHGILQFQFSEMKETLKQSEELLTEIRQMTLKQDGFVREVSDLKETVEWKDKKIAALERQKEYSDAIRNERDELRDEVVQLKDVLKKHGIVLGPDLTTNGETAEEGSGDPATRLADNSQTTPTEGNSMLGRAEEAQVGGIGEGGDQEEVDPGETQEEENHLTSIHPSSLASVPGTETCREEQTHLPTMVDVVDGSSMNNNCNLDNDIPTVEVEQRSVCDSEVLVVVTDPEGEVIGAGEEERLDGAEVMVESEGNNREGIVRTEEREVGSRSDGGLVTNQVEAGDSGTKLGRTADDITKASSKEPTADHGPLNDEKSKEEVECMDSSIVTKKTVEDTIAYSTEIHLEKDLDDAVINPVTSSPEDEKQNTEEKKESEKEEEEEEKEVNTNQPQPQEGSAAGQKKKKKKKGKKKKGETQGDEKQGDDRKIKEKSTVEKGSISASTDKSVRNVELTIGEKSVDDVVMTTGEKGVLSTAQNDLVLTPSSVQDTGITLPADVEICSPEEKCSSTPSDSHCAGAGGQSEPGVEELPDSLVDNQPSQENSMPESVDGTAEMSNNKKKKKGKKKKGERQCDEKQGDGKNKEKMTAEKGAISTSTDKSVRDVVFTTGEQDPVKGPDEGFPIETSKEESQTDPAKEEEPVTKMERMENKPQLSLETDTTQAVLPVICPGSNSSDVDDADHSEYKTSDDSNGETDSTTKADYSMDDSASKTDKTDSPQVQPESQTKTEKPTDKQEPTINNDHVEEESKHPNNAENVKSQLDSPSTSDSQKDQSEPTENTAHIGPFPESSADSEYLLDSKQPTVMMSNSVEDTGTTQPAEVEKFCNSLVEKCSSTPPDSHCCAGAGGQPGPGVEELPDCLADKQPSQENSKPESVDGTGASNDDGSVETKQNDTETQNQGPALETQETVKSLTEQDLNKRGPCQDDTDLKSVEETETQETVYSLRPKDRDESGPGTADDADPVSVEGENEQLCDSKAGLPCCSLEEEQDDPIKDRQEDKEAPEPIKQEEEDDEEEEENEEGQSFDFDDMDLEVNATCVVPQTIQENVRQVVAATSDGDSGSSEQRRRDAAASHKEDVEGVESQGEPGGVVDKEDEVRDGDVSTGEQLENKEDEAGDEPTGEQQDPAVEGVSVTEAPAEGLGRVTEEHQNPKETEPTIGEEIRSRNEVEPIIAKEAAELPIRVEEGFSDSRIPISKESVSVEQQGITEGSRVQNGTQAGAVPGTVEEGEEAIQYEIPGGRLGSENMEEPVGGASDSSRRGSKRGSKKGKGKGKEDCRMS